MRQKLFDVLAEVNTTDLDFSRRRIAIPINRSDFDQGYLGACCGEPSALWNFRAARVRNPSRTADNSDAVILNLVIGSVDKKLYLNKR
jgi:hypothetical protein